MSDGGRRRHGAPMRHVDDEDDDESTAQLYEEERTDAHLEAELGGVKELPDDWQDFVLRRLEPWKIAARKRDADDRKTLDEVFDKQTLLVLYKFISNGYLDTIDYPVSTGKEANVFHGTTPRGESIAVKIFRTNTATFRSFMTYIAGDPRFGHVRPHRRDIVHVWAQKEYKNLERYHAAGVRVPAPIAWRQNVLLMEFIGHDGTPAPRARDAPPADPQAAYDDLMAQYRLSVQKARLAHGDLSEYNLLNTGDELVIIDVAQSVILDHPMSRELLERDARNLTHWFKRLGVRHTAEETLAAMTPPPKAHQEDAEEER